MVKQHVVVIGLGTFGASLARGLSNQRVHVTGVDRHPERCEHLKEVLYESMIADATDRVVMEQLHLERCDAVCISLGEDITQSLLAALHARDLKGKKTEVVVKGVTDEHEKLLKALGVHRVVFPEKEVALSEANRLAGSNLLGMMELGDEHVISEIAVPDRFLGKTLAELNLRQRYRVTVVGLKSALGGKLEPNPEPSYRLQADQYMLVIGTIKDVQELGKSV